MMRIVVITAPCPVEGEGRIIRTLLEEGVWRLHLRRPLSSESGMRRLVESLPAELYPLLSIHDHGPLAVEYGLGGVHLNSRTREVPAGFAGTVSRSCHSLAEVKAATREDYLFLSPVFDSISKHGYGAGFTPDELRQAAAEGIVGRRVFALGGVTPKRLPLLRDLGFGGAALLGAVWNDTSPESIRTLIKTIRNI